MDENETSGFQIPEDLTTVEDLSALREQANAAFQDLRENIETDEDVAQIEALAALAEAIDAEESRRETVAAERQERIDRAASAFDRPAEGEDGGDEGEEEAPAEDEEPEGAEAAPEAVAAGGAPARAPMPRARKVRKPAAPETGVTLTITAAADVGDGIAAGQPLDGTAGLTQAFMARSRPFGNITRGGKVRHQFNVASINRKFGDGLSHEQVGVGKAFVDTYAMLREASRESRLPGGSLRRAVVAAAEAADAEGLVAAGGWCAPSENLYGLCQKETLDGIIDLPEVGVDRGGINYTPGPDFSTIYAAAGFVQTEAQAEAGETKPCTEIDCPPFSEVRLDAVGICVSAPILTRAAYPELVQRWIEGTIIANQHKVAARLITAMQTALGAALAPTLTGTPIAWSLLTMMEWHIEMERQAYRLSESETLEVKAPRWLRVLLRADLANRAGVAAASVTNAQIAEHFADRGAAVQFVLNYQEIANPLTSVAFPATVEIMVYPAGTFVKGTADVINLDTVYDSTGLAVNTYTAAFAEDGVLLAKMCHGGKRITLPVHVTGQMGALDINQTWGTAQVLGDA